jgi:hypothetical protein
MSFTFNHHSLISLLDKNLGLNLARLKCLSMLVFSLLEVQSSNLAKVAGFITSGAERASRYRRLQRFMEQVHLVPEKLGPLLLYIMEVPREEKLALVLDRTNWKFGKADCNILYLAVVWQGIGIPLFGLF